MKNLIKCTVVALLLALASEAAATPSRQIWIPSPDAQPFTTFNVGVDTYGTMFRKQGDNAQQRATNYGITAGLGLLPAEKLNLEVGIDLREPTDYPILFNAKVGLPENTGFPGMPALAIGGYDFGTKKNITNYNLIYGLAAKTVPFVGRLSAGYYFGNGGLLKDRNGKEDSADFMFSWDRSLVEISDKLWAAVDYQRGNNRYGAFSFGASWAFSESTSVLLGYQIYNDSGVMGKNTVTIQVDIDF
ncbi:MAG: hypothetical protein HZA78_12165 [Candidatus Schekmanbacteria bacterium]|nr:hypothetical protein [Candidatus Schekmanbacteria bacterium]